jgi:hypothetical protein
MRQSGIKWLVGGLMVSAGGILAVAGLPGRSSIVACDGPVALPVPMPITPVVNLEPPLQLPTPKPSDLPTTPLDTRPAPLSIPPIVETSKIPEPAKVPEPSKPVEVKPDIKFDLPKFEEPSKPTINPVIPAAASTPAVIPSIPAPGPAVPTIPSPAPEVKAVPPTPAPTKAVEPVFANPQPAQPVRQDLLPSTVESSPVGRPAIQPTTTPVLERKLKVVLHLGDERPRFEVRDGDEVYLKVISERVEVKSPSDNGENMSVLRASGKVKFITPGGEGTCDELILTPGKGQLTVQGKVSFKHTWGKSETIVTGPSMMFRLGQLPQVATGSEIPDVTR